MFRNAKIKITIVTLITSYTNLATLKPVNIPLFKLLSILHVYSWHSNLSLRLHGPWLFDVIGCLDNFLCFSYSSRTSPFWKHSVLFFSVGLPRTVCAFVSLTQDNIIEQYINTFLETPRPNVIKTASYCCFEKFWIKRYPSHPWLDYPLDLTKSTNHKIRKENGHKIKKTTNSDDLLGNM